MEVLLADAKTAIEAAPGPTPWCTPAIARDSGTLQWRHFSEDPLVGVAMLEDRGAAIAIFDFQCYLWPLSKKRWLIWHHTGPENLPEALRISIFDPAQLSRIENPDESAREMRSRKGRVAINGEPLGSFDIPCNLEAGIYNIAIGGAFEDVPELLAYSRTTVGKPDRWDKGDCTLLEITPRKNIVAVHPQNWFNEGSYDFGYQWPCIVTREPKSRVTVGYGIRLGTYAYPVSLGEITWLDINPFAGFAPTTAASGENFGGGKET